MNYVYIRSESSAVVHVLFWANFITQTLSCVSDGVSNCCGGGMMNGEIEHSVLTL